MVGVQLYAFKRTAVEADVAGILRDLRAVGYDAVEGLPGHRENYWTTLDSLGMRYAAPHVSLDELNAPEQLVRYLKDMGGADICSSGPVRGREAGADDYRATCDVLNDRGRELRKSGIHLHYHNHEFEFAPLEGETTGMDILLQGIDLEAVDLCFDVGWAWRAGADPAVFMRSHGPAVAYIHARDFSGAKSVPLGEGDMDLAAVMAAVRELPRLRWFVVEHDPGSAQPVRDLEISRRFLGDNVGR